MDSIECSSKDLKVGKYFLYLLQRPRHEKQTPCLGKQTAPLVQILWSYFVQGQGWNLAMIAICRYPNQVMNYLILFLGKLQETFRGSYPVLSYSILLPSCVLL